MKLKFKKEKSYVIHVGDETQTFKLGIDEDLGGYIKYTRFEESGIDLYVFGCVRETLESEWSGEILLSKHINIPYTVHNLTITEDK